MKTKTPSSLKYSVLGLSTALAATIAQASTDYGPAIWNPIPNNFYTTGYGHKFLVIHDMEGYYATVRSVLINRGVSVHYACNGLKDASTDAPAGEISQFVREANYAWDASCWNKHHIGTEHEGFASNPAWYSEAQYAASAGLQRHLCDKFGIAKDRNHVVGHGEWQNAAWRSWASANLGIDPNCNTHTDPGPYWDWSHFMGLITGTGSNPGGCGACSRGSGLMDVFTRSSANKLWKKSFGSGVWSAWQNLGDTITSDPAAVSKDANTTEVFWANAGTVYHKSWTTSGGWSAAFSLGGLTISGAPAICSRPTTGGIDVFARGTDNHLWKNTWTGSAWSGWSNLGETVMGDPAACAKGANEVDVFWRGSDGSLWKKTWTTGGGWSASNSLGGAITWGPGAISKDGTTIDVFVRGTDTSLYKNSWTGSGWSGFQYLGGALASSPDAGSSDSSSVNSFYRGMDNNVYQEYWQASCNCWNLSNLGHE